MIMFGKSDVGNLKDAWYFHDFMESIEYQKITPKELADQLIEDNPGEDEDIREMQRLAESRLAVK